MPKKGIDKIAKEKFIFALSKINKVEEIENFLSDLMSSAELKDLSRRYLACEYLNKGKTYEEIRYDLGMGMSTINKVRFKTKGSRILNELTG